MKIAVPQFGEEVAPCFDYSVTIVIFDIKNNQIVGEKEFTLSSQWAVDRIRLLRDQQVDVLICGGIQDRFEDIVRANGIEVISWVSGNAKDLIQKYLNRTLTSDTQKQAHP
ncbi:MAG: NifB/NifX family molybdenum-iron cluster-binding protein [Myxococcota bacterium]|nr:NifB/NifX family molybdenum-iron cluster-binding protein [Myxococcota bacterium]